ncbi:MAG: AtpZ/AtpI family protein [Planctomycetota bacterium]
MAKNDGDRRSMARFYGIGLNYVGAVAGCGLFGYWLDRRYGCEPWGVLIGAGLGLIGGTYNLMRESLSAFRGPPDRRDKGQPPST